MSKTAQKREAPRPEHEKLAKVKDKTQACGEFIEWLAGKGIRLAAYSTESGGYHPISKSIQDLLAEHFGIDRKKLEKEKDQMLDEIRRANAG